MNKAGFCEDRLRNIDRLLKGWVERGELPCVQAMVTRHGELAYSAAYGASNMESGTPLRDDAIFRIYSMSKVFTSVSMMILHEQGLYKMHDPVAKFIPEYGKVRVGTLTPQGDIVLVEPKRPLEIRDLFTMTSGIPYPGGNTISGAALKELYAQMEADEKAGKPWDTQRVVREYARAPLCFHPGEHWRYGFSIDVLGALVEVMSGMKLGEFMKKHIFEPLGLKDTGFYVDPAKAERLVTMYEVDDADKFTPIPNYAECFVPPVFEGGGGGLYSTAADVTRFARMLLGGGAVDGVRVLSRKSVELMSTNHLNEAQLQDYNWETQRGYGYGLAVRVMMHPELAGYGSVGEFAWDGMAGTWFSVDPREDMVSVFMVQTNPGRHYRFVPLYAQAVYGAIVD